VNVPPTNRTTRIGILPAIPLDPIMHSHGWAYLAPLEQTQDGFRYPVVFGVGGTATLQVAASKTGVVVRTERHLSTEQKRRLLATAKHMLSADFPLAEFQDVCRRKKAKTLLRLAKRGWGRMLRSPSFWEDAVKTLCTTNASWGYLPIDREVGTHLGIRKPGDRGSKLDSNHLDDWGSSGSPPTS
jgi:hypothetical protein